MPSRVWYLTSILIGPAKDLFGQGKCRKAAVPATVPGMSAHEATVGESMGRQRVGHPEARKPGPTSGDTPCFATDDGAKECVCAHTIPLVPRARPRDKRDGVCRRVLLEPSPCLYWLPDCMAHRLFPSISKHQAGPLPSRSLRVCGTGGR